LITPVVMVLLSGTAFAEPGPGELIQSNFPGLRSEATVTSTAIANDGSIFLLGDFNEVDGIPRPGLAKLGSTGHLDSSFDPQIGVESKIQVRTDFTFIPTLTPTSGSAIDLGNTFEPKVKPRHLYFPDTELFALNQGRLFLRRGTAWTVLDANGSVDEEAFPGFDRSEASALPQVLLDDRLIVLTANERLVALDLADHDSLDPGFNLDPSWTGTILQAVAADTGKLWILSQRDQVQVVCRLNSDGSMDSGFPPLELRDGLNYRIEPGSGGGFILTNVVPNFITRPIYPFPPIIQFPPIISFPEVIACCGFYVRKNEQRIQWFDRIGIQRGESRINLGSSNRPLFQTHPWHQAVFFNTILGGWQSQGSQGDPVLLSEFPIAAPDQNSDLPMVFETIDLIKAPLGGAAHTYLLGGTRSFTADYTPDPHHHIARLTRQAINLQARKRPDGSLLVSGEFNQADQFPCRGMIRISPGGEIDESFIPDLDLRFTREFEVHSDGRIVALLDRPWTSPDGEEFSLLTLSANGKFERGYFAGGGRSGATQIELLADDSLLVEFSSSGNPFSAWDQNFVIRRPAFLQRILPSGELDTDWSVSQTFVNFGSQKILALRDETFFWGGELYDSDGILIQTITGASQLNPLCQDHEGAIIFSSPSPGFRPFHLLQRWRGGPDFDPNFVSGLSSKGNLILGAQAGTRGKILVWGRLKTPSGRRSLARLHGTGQIDYTFDPSPLEHRLIPESTPAILTTMGLRSHQDDEFASRSAPGFVFEQTDSFLIGGSFGEIDGNIALLDDSHLFGYSDWITNATGDQQLPSGDFDQDGRSNLHEYALGTDPIRPDALIREFRIISHSPLRFQIRCNPDAPEVRRTIEVSPNLSNWEIGTAHHFATEPGLGCLNLRMTESHHRLFLRARYSLP